MERFDGGSDGVPAERKSVWMGGMSCNWSVRRGSRVHTLLRLLTRFKIVSPGNLARQSCQTQRLVAVQANLLPAVQNGPTVHPLDRTQEGFSTEDTPQLVSGRRLLLIPEPEHDGPPYSTVTLNEVDVTGLLHEFVLAVENHRVDSGLWTHLPRTLWTGLGTEHPLLVNGLGPPLCSDQVVIVILAVNVGPLGNTDSYGRLSKKFGQCQQPARLEIDLGYPGSRVEAVSREIWLVDSRCGREVDFVGQVVEEEL